MNREQAMRGAGDVIGCIPADTLRDPVTADAERARIVAWLRGWAQDQKPLWRRLVLLVADAIERGDHWQTEGGE